MHITMQSHHTAAQENSPINTPITPSANTQESTSTLGRTCATLQHGLSYALTPMSWIIGKVLPAQVPAQESTNDISTSDMRAPQSQASSLLGQISSKFYTLRLSKPLSEFNAFLDRRTQEAEATPIRSADQTPPSSDILIKKCNHLLAEIAEKKENMGAEVNNRDTVLNALGALELQLKEKALSLKAAPHKIIHPEPNSTRPIPTQLDEQPERLAARHSAAKTIEIIEASLQPLDTVQAMESDNSWRGSDLEHNLQHFMKRQLQRSQTATQALSHIQQARPALYEAHFKEWHTLWERFEHLPELRTAYDKLMLPPNRHDPNRETEPSETELAARLLKLMDAGELDTPANISTQGAVTHIINTLTDDHFATQLKQQSKVSKLLLPFITETLSELQSDTPNIDVKALRKLQSYLGHLCKAIQTKLPQKTMSHSEKQTLLREIDALQKRLTLCQETVALKQALGTPSLSETFSRIYTLRPYHTSLESVGYILGPITEQQEALNSWQSQIEPMANGSDDASELDCTLQWLKGTLLELSTQQACEQAEKTNRQITTLDAIQAVKKGAQASNNIAHTASENRSSAAAAQDLSQLLQPHEIIVNGQNEQGEITDRLAATIETPEGTLSIFDAALWGYLVAGAK